MIVFLFVFPIIFVLLLGTVSVGMYFSTRGAVTAIARDAAQAMAAYGEDCPVPDVIPGKAKCFSEQAEQRLWAAGKCTLSSCDSRPRVTCSTADGGPVVRYVGEVVTCTVDYPYRGINRTLLNSPMGLGIGSLLKPYTVEGSSIAEVGADGTIGIQ